MGRPRPRPATNPEQSRGKPTDRTSKPPSRMPSMADLLIEGSGVLFQCGGGNGESAPPMFRTGLGKSVRVKQSSIQRALSVLGEEDRVEKGQVRRADFGCDASNSFFQTGSGKMVNVSSAGLIRAKALLSLEENSTYSADRKSNGWGDGLHSEKMGGAHNDVGLHIASVPGNMNGFESIRTPPNHWDTEVCRSSANPPAVKFQTAGGRAISVSNDALQRARSLLGDSDFSTTTNERATDGLQSLVLRKSRFSESSLNKEDDPSTSLMCQDSGKSMCTFESSLPAKGPFSKRTQESRSSDTLTSGGDNLKKFDSNGFAYEGSYVPDSAVSCIRSSNGPCERRVGVDCFLPKGIGPGEIPNGRSIGGPLVDISNTMGTSCEVLSNLRLPFRFSTPLKNQISLLPNDSSTLASTEESGQRKRFSVARYPLQPGRETLEQYFGGPPRHQNLLQVENIPDKVKHLSAGTAATYVFRDDCLGGIGAEAFFDMLVQAGASNISKEWVANHFKWIVWKLACYERGFPAKATGKVLTIANVFEELKYRYEKEVNHGHRSALKKITEGDASPASMMILCVSSIHTNPSDRLQLNQEIPSFDDANKLGGSCFNENCNAAKIELTDGWYSLDAHLDLPLSKQLREGKLFVGQKIREIPGCIGFSFAVTDYQFGPACRHLMLASKTVNLLLHINGTYRAHWADRLGMCKYPGAPLAFNCIKSSGGLVPKTFLGVTRIYPILYKERLKDGGSIVRSERTESRMLQLYDQRRLAIAEGIMSEFESNVSTSHCKNESESEEGEKIFRILENAAEPEILMADMSTEQLSSISSYRAKQEERRRSAIEKGIEKALADSGLCERQVTPFMRVRVIGLIGKHSNKKHSPKEGFVTIWSPTEKQRLKIVEGQAYMVAGLMPLNLDSDTIHLQARGSATTWKSLSSSEIADFEPFFSPRKAVLLSHLGEVPLASEFDAAALVVHVGEPRVCGHQKQQWVFVTDGFKAGNELQSEESSNALLAISFWFPIIENEPFLPMNYALEGSTVGFCNLIKRARDQVNHLWVAEATDNSTYSLLNDLPTSHLNEAAGAANRWAKISSLAIKKLKEKVLFIIAMCGIRYLKVAYLLYVSRFGSLPSSVHV
ncbi:hypothetical protein Syun_016130 [Stephania yunnanensis]|uniref:Breast cancer type 2 susceptibility protein n=1 Tax=Stephania yunnanensis TaxID=152371 RepID=A0AAP0J4L4_9MAGN